MISVKKSFPGKRARLAVLSLVILFLSIFLLIASELQRRWVWANETLDSIGPRYARLLGLKQSASDIDAALKFSRDEMTKLGFGKDVPVERIGGELQQRVREIAANAGLNVQGSQILPAKAGDGFTAITVALNLEGGLDACRAFLLHINDQPPQIFIDSVQLQENVRRRNARSGGNDSGDTLSMRISLVVVRLNQ